MAKCAQFCCTTIFLLHNNSYYQSASIIIGSGKCFTRKMRKSLTSGQWLYDDHMKLAQRLLKEEFPKLDGFQSTLLSQNDGFCPVKGDALQIHHINSNHWVTSSSIGNEVVIYDSKFTGGDLPSSLAHQLALLYRTWAEEDEGEIELALTVPSVQQQVGANDCGLFAIAFAVHAALGESVDELEFDQAQMREHLIKCFTKKRMLPFPTVEECSARENYFPHRVIELFCVCLMPETYGDMIECDNCSKWFHLKCMNLSDPPGVQDIWHCPNCM